MKKYFILTVVALVIAMTGMAQAVALLPGPGTDGQAVLHVGDPATGPFIYGGTELVSMSSTHLQILDVNGPQVFSPVWLVLGVANLSGAEYSAPLANGISATADGALTSGMKLYEDIFGIAKGDASQSFTNWAAAENALTGIDAAKFGIYVYAFDTTITGKEIIDVTFSSSLQNGTFALAVAGAGGSDYATTPFTQTGFYKTPEPATLLLFGSGILGLGFFGRKRFTK